MALPFERIHTTEDRVEAELFRSTLEAEGIEVQVGGFADAALLGAAPSILPMTLSVRPEDAERARAMIAALRDPQTAEAIALPSDDPELPEAGRPRSQRRPAYLAAGLAFVFPSGAHLYARRWWTAPVFWAGWVVSIVADVASRRDPGSALPLLILADLIGGTLAARTFNRGLDVGRGRQLVNGAALVLVVLALAHGGPAVDAWRAHRARAELLQLQISCTPEALTIVNGGSDARLVAAVVMRVQEVPSMVLFPDEIAAARIEAGGPADALLAPQATLAIPLRWHSDDTACRAGQALAPAIRPTSCLLHYTLTVRTSATGEALVRESRSCALR